MDRHITRAGARPTGHREERATHVALHVASDEARDETGEEQKPAHRSAFDMATAARRAWAFVLNAAELERVRASQRS